MNKVLWVDAQILKFFNKIAKDFNWLTGLDNFFLALLSSGLGLLTSFLHFAILSDLVLFAIIFNPTFAIFIYIITKDTKNRKHIEQLNGAKDYLLFVELIFHRSLWFLFSAGSFLTLASDYDKFTFLYPMFFLFQWAWACFCSIDQSPFQKSQALLKIKNWAKSLQQQYELKPIPVIIPPK